jgi:hypothetical protein
MAGLTHLELLTDFFNRIDPQRRFGVRLYCNAARECPTMAARCTTRPFH